MEWIVVLHTFLDQPAAWLHAVLARIFYYQLLILVSLVSLYFYVSVASSGVSAEKKQYFCFT